jgi:release factor glutamine methyltransferase
MSLADRLGSAAEARWLTQFAPPDRLEELVERRLSGEPLQYVLGTWAFRDLELTVDQRALIPRPETEQVVEVALGLLGGRPHPVVVDLGTGSGAIALSVAVERPEAEVWATDLDPSALELARVNRERTGATVELCQGSWYEALPPPLRGRVDLVVSNPPYVSDEEWPGLDQEVRREPRQALVAGDGSDGTPGLADVEAVLAGAPEWLVPGGWVVVELAPLQARAASALAARFGLGNVAVAQDLAGRDRAVTARSAPASE